MNAERKLIWTIWGVIFLLALLWRFWPGEPTAKAVSVELQPGPELSTFFLPGTVVENQPSLLKVSLPLKTTQSRKARTVQLGYSLMSLNGVAFNGTTLCPVAEGEELCVISLPNPNHVSVRAIRLYLAR